MNDNNIKISKTTIALVIVIFILVIGFAIYIINQNKSKTGSGDLNNQGTVQIEQGKTYARVDNKMVQLTAENAANYYGKKVANYTQGGITYRLFYVDEEGKYGDKGMSYIIADYQKKDVDLGAYKTYSAANASVMKKLNPEWAKEDGTIDTKHENIVSWLLNPNEWKEYANSYASYAVGAPSVEMYVDSYKQAMNLGNYQTRMNQYGYEISADSGKSWYTSAKQRFTEDNNEIYITKAGIFWLSSMSGGNEDCIFAASQQDEGIISMGYSEPYGFRPLVALPASFKLDLK